MNDTPTKSEYPLEPPGPDRPTWQKVLSREVSDQKRQAEDLYGRLEARYGKGVPSGPEFTEVFWRLVQDRKRVRVLEVTYGRAIRAAEVDDFEGRFQATLEALQTHADAPHNSVPLSFQYYLGEAVDQVVAQKEKGELPDLEAAAILFELGEKLYESSRLIPLRVDGSEGDKADPALEVTRKLIGRTLGPYAILRRQGKGGFAEVFLAKHLKLDVERALKVLLHVPPAGPARQKAYEGFLNEARTQAKLDHPNVVRLLDVGDEEGLLYLVMDYVEGRTLAHLAYDRVRKDKPFTSLEVLDFGISIAEGLKYAHSHQIVHRDLKPENVLIGDDGRVRIVDFGLARRLAESGHRQVTQNGYLIGTPQYMAPEQVGGGGKGETYDQRADLYSFGVALYHLASGTVPFDDEDIWTILRLHREEEPTPLRDQRDDLDPELERIVLKCLKKRPEDRYADAEELLVDLRACRDRVARGEAAPAPVPKRPSKAPAVVGLLGALATIILLGIVFLPGMSADPALTREPNSGTEIEKPVEAPVPVSPLPKPTPLSKEAGIAKAPSPPAKEIAKVLPKSPAAAKAEPAKPRPAPPKVPTLRQRLLAHPATAEEIRQLGEIADVFGRNRAELLDRSFEKTLTELETLAKSAGDGEGGTITPDGQGYVAAHLGAARKITENAQGVVNGRWEELRTAKGPVSITRRDGSVVKGTVRESTPSEIVLADEKGGVQSVAFADVSPNEFATGGALPESIIAYGALSVDAPEGLKSCVETAERSEHLALAVPFILRLSRESARDLAAAVAGEIEKRVISGTGSGIGSGKAAFEKAGKLIQEIEEDVLHVYPYLGAEFEIVQREEAMISLLEKGAYARILAEGRGTVAFPVAARLYRSGFTGEVSREGVEVLAKTGWHAFGWKLRPDIEELTEKLKYWSLEPATGGIKLRGAGDVPRKLVMTRGMPEEGKGVAFQIAWSPDADSGETSEWRFVLKSSGEGSAYLRSNSTSLGIYRGNFGGREADTPIIEELLATGAGTLRSFSLISSASHLHVFVDGDHLLSVPAKDAEIPKQLAFVVTRGTASIRSVRVLGGGLHTEKNQ